MKTIVIMATLLSAMTLSACGKKEEVKPVETPTPVVDGQGQPVKAETGSTVVTTAPAASAPAVPAKQEEAKK